MATIIKWTPTAKQDLKQITFFYKGSIGKTATNKIVKAIEYAITLLAPHIRLGFVEPKRQNEQVCYRSLIVKYHKIIYWVQDETIHIARIFDCRQDPDKISDGL